jgi:hypothetical protein
MPITHINFFYEHTTYKFFKLIKPFFFFFFKDHWWASYTVWAEWWKGRSTIVPLVNKSWLDVNYIRAFWTVIATKSKRNWTFQSWLAARKNCVPGYKGKILSVGQSTNIYWMFTVHQVLLRLQKHGVLKGLKSCPHEGNNLNNNVTLLKEWYK